MLEMQNLWSLLEWLSVCIPVQLPVSCAAVPVLSQCEQWMLLMSKLHWPLWICFFTLRESLACKWLKDKENTGQGVEGGKCLLQLLCRILPGQLVVYFAAERILGWRGLCFLVQLCPLSITASFWGNLFSSLFLLWLCLVCLMLLRHLNRQNNLFLFSL